MVTCGTPPCGPTATDDCQRHFILADAYLGPKRRFSVVSCTVVVWASLSCRRARSGRGCVTDADARDARWRGMKRGARASVFIAFRCLRDPRTPYRRRGPDCCVSWGVETPPRRLGRSELPKMPQYSTGSACVGATHTAVPGSGGWGGCNPSPGYNGRALSPAFSLHDWLDRRSVGPDAPSPTPASGAML